MYSFSRIRARLTVSHLIFVYSSEEHPWSPFVFRGHPGPRALWSASLSTSPPSEPCGRAAASRPPSRHVRTLLHSSSAAGVSLMAALGAVVRQPHAGPPWPYRWAPPCRMLHHLGGPVEPLPFLPAWAVAPWLSRPRSRERRWRWPKMKIAYL
jgi:hypothetical protein